MPLSRYFLYIGAVLLALLLIFDWYAPPPSPTPVRSDVDRSTIRINSAHKWPKAEVIDTTLPTIVPPAAVAAVETPAPAPNPAREAFAMATEPVPAAKPEAARPAKSYVRRTRTARAPNSHAASPEPFSFRNDWFAPPRREVSASPRNETFGSRGMWSW